MEIASLQIEAVKLILPRIHFDVRVSAMLVDELDKRGAISKEDFASSLRSSVEDAERQAP